ncbi:MAG: hypothetical protein MAG451_01393 [Anaerolineales bacterium]|nr:hypothetical protein [Anaerolineales bacterium]
MTVSAQIGQGVAAILVLIEAHAPLDQVSDAVAGLIGHETREGLIVDEPPADDAVAEVDVRAVLRRAPGADGGGLLGAHGAATLAQHRLFQHTDAGAGRVGFDGRHEAGGPRADNDHIGTDDFEIHVRRPSQF